MTTFLSLYWFISGKTTKNEALRGNAAVAAIDITAMIGEGILNMRANTEYKEAIDQIKYANMVLNDIKIAEGNNWLTKDDISNINGFASYLLMGTLPLSNKLVPTTYDEKSKTWNYEYEVDKQRLTRFESLKLKINNQKANGNKSKDTSPSIKNSSIDYKNVPK